MEFCIDIIILVFSFVSCSHEIPTEVHEYLHGVWAKEGFTDSLRLKHISDSAFKALNDTINFIRIDICYDGERKIWPLFRDGYNPDTLTYEERYSKNSIWVLECGTNQEQNSYRFYYQGNNYFVTKPNDNQERHYCKINDLNDNHIEYGVLDKTSHVKYCVRLELLFHEKQWYFERYDFGWSETLSHCSKLPDYLHRNSLYGTQKVSLFKKCTDIDSLIATYSLDDINKEKDIKLSGYSCWLNVMKSRLKPVKFEEVTGDQRTMDSYFLLRWSGDTAFLENERLTEDYYVFLSKKE